MQQPSSAPPGDEFLDLVDANDRVVGRMLRSKVYADGRTDFRVVNAFVVNAAGELWIPRRGPHKRIFPDALDMSMGGHVESGEDYDDAFRREVREELNIDVDALGYRVLGKATPHEDGTSAFMTVYELRVDDAPVYNPDDFTEARWIAPAELLALLDAGEPCKEDLPRLVRKYFG